MQQPAWRVAWDPGLSVRNEKQKGQITGVVGWRTLHAKASRGWTRQAAHVSTVASLALLCQPAWTDVICPGRH
ncbi:hypothetical protein Trco_002612 [Trichoderma cornu-damae]|uniref:Uncharacterized protein n=1 Tax=Trichoderma cornu-damae TaxID=654480 RepID=A0A9P8QMZ7_9HYPO|nr:hypothetical protein Trco_002612 [Trichoderma cornu-damae]